MSDASVLSSVYPHISLNNAHQKAKPFGYWNELENQRQFLDNLAKELNLQTAQDWTSVTTEMVISRDGGGLLKRFNGSLYQALVHVSYKHSFHCLLCSPILTEIGKL
jgi:hypothetical protein